MPRSRVIRRLLIGLLMCFVCCHAVADQPQGDSLQYSDNFERSSDAWLPSDSSTWRITATDAGNAYQLLGPGNYRPPHRSPVSIALLKDHVWGDFELTARVKTTKKTYGHRDMCVFFGFQDPGHFYYAHLGERPDPHSSQIFVVDGADRRKITESADNGIPWKDDTWHTVKVVRRVRDGLIEVYFDDMNKPCKTAHHTGLNWGLIGLGSFDDKGLWDDVQIRGVRAEGTAQLFAANDPAKTKQASVMQPPLIPRKTLFGNPKKARARLSPDGSRMAFLAPVDGVLNVWAGKTDDLESAQAVTADKKRGITSYFWAYTNRHLLYTQDVDGNEDFHLYCVDLETNAVRDLTPLEKITARVEGVSEHFPDEILVGINDRPPHTLHDIYRINIQTGERHLVQVNPGFAGFVTDDHFRVRFAMTYTPDAGQLYLRPAKGDVDDKDHPAHAANSEKKPKEAAGWSEFLQFGPEDGLTSGLSGFDKTEQKVYLLDSRQRDTAALKILDLKNGQEVVLAENDRADMSGALAHPTEKHVQAVAFTYDRQKWQVLDPAIQPDLDYLQTVADGELEVTSRTLDDRLWTVAYIMDNGPVKFYLYDRTKRAAKFLFSSDPDMELLPLVPMHSTVIPSRDSLNLVSYYSLPAESDPDKDGIPNKPLPMVLDVHGGPWARDGWGYNPTHQWLANRGYAVLNVNFRGSTGFGKKFINAANGQWSGAMQEDLMDGVAWAVKIGIAQPDKVAIMGGSYGGYATLVGMTHTPTAFACGVDIVGPSSLVTLLENPPPYWVPFQPVMKLRVGDHETKEGRAALLEKSPLTKVDKIVRPLLIGQGKHDPRVKQAEADQIVAAMKERGIPVTYLLYTDEGHGFARPENRFSFNAVTEAFLGQHLGGRIEPIGDAFEGAVFEVPSGAEQIPGLAEALAL